MKEIAVFILELDFSVTKPEMHNCNASKEKLFISVWLGTLYNIQPHICFCYGNWVDNIVFYITGVVLGAWVELRKK